MWRYGRPSAPPDPHHLTIELAAAHHLRDAVHPVTFVRKKDYRKPDVLVGVGVGRTLSIDLDGAYRLYETGAGSSNLNPVTCGEVIFKIDVDYERSL